MRGENGHVRLVGEEACGVECCGVGVVLVGLRRGGLLIGGGERARVSWLGLSI